MWTWPVGSRDKTDIARRHGYWFDEALSYPGSATPDGPTVAGLTIAARRDNAPIHLDVIGVAAPRMTSCAKPGCRSSGVNVAESATTTDQSGRLRFANLRAQVWWKMREALDPANNTGICLPPDPQLKSDLCAPTWSLRGSAIQVESREDIVRRIGRSPTGVLPMCWP